MSSTGIDYTQPSPELRAGSNELLVGFRDSSNQWVEDGPWVIFDQPDAWQAMSPFLYAKENIEVSVSVQNGQTEVTQLYFGYNSWDGGDGACDQWNNNPYGPNGKICFTSQQDAPSYFHWARSQQDLCHSECCADTGPFPCTAERRYTIGIRTK